jgi:transcriptional regulator with XRE-family HTH domain
MAGEEARTLRRATDVTQVELGELCGVSQQAVAKPERQDQLSQRCAVMLAAGLAKAKRRVRDKARRSAGHG